MPKYEVSWNAFGFVVVDAENEAEAITEAYDVVRDELDFSDLDYDGIDIGDVDDAADWQTAVN